MVLTLILLRLHYAVARRDESRLTRASIVRDIDRGVQSAAQKLPAGEQEVSAAPLQRWTPKKIGGWRIGVELGRGWLMCGRELSEHMVEGGAAEGGELIIADQRRPRRWT